MALALKIWIVILVVGVLNYLSRLSFVAIFANRTMPPLLVRALKYVPAAMLTALVVPMVLPVGEQGIVVGPRVPAAVLATGVAFFTRSTLATLASGMIALWLIEAFAA